MATRKNQKTAETLLTKTGTLQLPVDTVNMEKDDNNTIFNACVESLNMIFKVQNSAVLSMARIFYIVEKKELYKNDKMVVTGEKYKSLAQWAKEKYGVPASSLSESLKVYKRFFNHETGEIIPKYSKYNYSSLIKMSDLQDDEIKALGLDQTTDKKTIVDKIKEKKNKEKKNKEKKNKDEKSVTEDNEELTQNALDFTEKIIFLKEAMFKDCGYPIYVKELLNDTIFDNYIDDFKNEMKNKLSEMLVDRKLNNDDYIYVSFFGEISKCNNLKENK